MANKKKSPPMYFVSLEIENIKCFGHNQTLDLRDSTGAISRWTLILGDNGIGKTTLLKCITWMTPVKKPKQPPVENQPGNETESDDTREEFVEIKALMDDFDDETEFEQLIRVGDNVKTKISGTLTNGVKLGGIPGNENTVSVGMNFEKKNGKLEVITNVFGKLKEFNSPNIYAYSASRHMALKNFEKMEIVDSISNLFSTSGDLFDAEQVLSSLHYASISEKIENTDLKIKTAGKSTQLLNKIKQILADLLPDIQDVESIVINPPLDKNGVRNPKLVEMKTPYGKVSLYELSLGYKTMLAWTVDLAIRMFWKHPDSDEPLNEPAVVLVDEVDLHLHPKWQRIVRTYLTTHFKNTQFICTAHSPIMAQSSDKDNLCVLNRIGDEVFIENNPTVVHGWRIGQVITSDLFGIPERSFDFDIAINRRREILDKGKLSKDDEIELKRLDDELADLPVLNNEDQLLLKQIRKAAEILKEKGTIE